MLTTSYFASVAQQRDSASGPAPYRPQFKIGRQFLQERGAEQKLYGLRATTKKKNLAFKLAPFFVPHHSTRFLGSTAGKSSCNFWLIFIMSGSAECLSLYRIDQFRFHRSQSSDYLFVPAQKTQEFRCVRPRGALAIASKTERNHGRLRDSRRGCAVLPRTADSGDLAATTTGETWK